MTPEVFDARIISPAGIICAGAPMAGKTTLILKLLQHSHRLFTKEFDYIYWFYGQRNKSIEWLEANPDLNIIPVAGLPKNIDEYIFPDKNGFHIYDDLMNEASSNTDILDLASRKCHHNSVSWCLIMQNMFHHGRERVTLLRCAHYFILFKNPLDKTMAYNLANKIMPKNQKCFIDIYDEATSKPNSYLFIDGAQGTPENARFKSNITDIVQTVYVPIAQK